MMDSMSVLALALILLSCKHRVFGALAVSNNEGSEGGNGYDADAHAIRIRNHLRIRIVSDDGHCCPAVPVESTNT